MAERRNVTRKVRGFATMLVCAVAACALLECTAKGPRGPGEAAAGPPPGAHTVASAPAAEAPAAEEAGPDKVERKVVDAIARILDAPRDRLKPEIRLADDLGADELDMVELVMDLKDTFNISIEEGAEPQTVGDAVKCVRERVSDRK